MPRQALPRYAQECAACHMAYPPGLLPAASWHRIMGRLERHFGSEASLDEASVREIGAEVWRRPGVKSPANCLACHGGAERGDFEDDRVRIPK